jgi:hypothetical protein
MKELWEVAFVTPLKEFLAQMGDFLPRLMAMLVIVAAGMVVAYILKRVTARILKVMRFDQFSSRMGLSQALGKGGVSEPPSMLLGRVVYWVIFLIFLVLGLGALQLGAVDRVAAQAMSYVPNLFIALIILMVGFILSNFFGRATLIAAVNAQISQARLIARAVRLGVILFALAMAFEQLGIATTIIVAAFSITFGGVVLALAIAFGLGGREAAREIVEGGFHGSQEEPEKKEGDVSHL